MGGESADGLSCALRQSALARAGGRRYRFAAAPHGVRRCPATCKFVLELAPGRQGLAAKLPPGRRDGSDAGAGAGRGAPPLSVARPLHARPDERREVLRRAAAARRDDDRRHGRRSRRLREPALQAGRFRRRHGRLAALRAERRARPQQGRCESGSVAGLSRPARHARRYGLVGPQHDHRAQGGRDGAGHRGDRRGRLGGRPARQARRRAGDRRRRRP